MPEWNCDAARLRAAFFTHEAERVRASCPLAMEIVDMLDARINEILSVFPEHVVAYVMATTRIKPLALGERYADASPMVREIGSHIDAWPVVPAGLFVVPERTIYVRTMTPMTLVHEFGHALDCALGKGVYRSGYDAHIRKAFQCAKEFVTPYAAVSLDEYMAESLRAFVGSANEKGCPWPAVSRERLFAIDPMMHDIIEVLIAECGMKQ
jgi:hypothetical protein